MESSRFFRRAFQANTSRRWQRWQANIVLCLVVALLLTQFFSSKQNFIQGNSLKKLDDVLASYLTPVQQLRQSASTEILSLSDWFQTKNSNSALAAENKALREQLRVAEQAVEENAVLRGLLNMTAEQSWTVAAARVVGFGGITADQELLVNVGSRGGVKLGDLAMNAEGLVGRVIAVSEGSSRVLMLTHPDSKVPVMVQPGNMRAMMVGDAGHQAVLTYAQQPGELKPGQRVITAGIGDGIPYGLVLGTIAEPTLGNHGQLRVQLASRGDSSNHLRLVRYGSKQLYSSLSFQVN
ncbi:MAG: rod shape-determining protein MreC [Alphaproteobacteria bacterium]|nr:rod shape-determining protein MreC [Alphaproteobacteria bacterium]